MIKFSKFHAFGNDYVVIEAEQLRDVTDIFEFTKRFCHRNLGVGSDGIAILEKLNEANADFSCRIINPDGSEAGFSGNGTRCAVAYAYCQGLWTAENLRLRMNTGVKNYRLIEEMSAGHYWFEAEIGKPKFSSDEIPILTETKLDSVINYQLSIINYQLEVSCVSVGNPVAVIFVEEFSDFDWRVVGKKIESHKKFPHRTNIVFVKVIDLDNIEIRIWERGAGETSSSGTCSTAAAIIHLANGNLRGTVHVHAEGGTTDVTWRDDDEMLILGRADFVFSGEYF